MQMNLETIVNELATKVIKVKRWLLTLILKYVDEWQWYRWTMIEN